MSDLILLESFLEVAEAGSISTAARRLHVSQPALSRRLQQLEEELDTVLFERMPRGMALTEPGRLVLREGHALMEHWHRMHRAAQAMERLEAGIVRIGGGATAVSFLLPQAIAEFQREHPGLLFQVKEAGSRDIEQDVAAERLELGIVTMPVASDAFEVTRLRKDRIVLVAASEHPLAQRRRVPVKQLEGEAVVAFESPSAIRGLIDEALREAGVRVNVVMELRSIPAILRMVRTTRCLAFVSQLGTLEGLEGCRVLPLAGLRIERALAVIRKRDRPLSPAALAFARRLRA